MSHRPKLAALALLVCSSALNPAVAQKPTRTLNLYIWSDYIDPSVVKTFEAQTHSKLRITLFESAEEMVAKLQTGGKGQYDVVCATDYMVPVLTHAGLLRPLERAKIPNLAHIGGAYLGRPYDPKNAYTVPYMFATLGLGYRKDVLKAPKATWGLIFDPQQQPGAFSLLDSQRELLGAALRYLGRDLNSTRPRDLADAVGLLEGAKKRARSLDATVATRNKLMSKEIVVGMLYGGDLDKGAQEDKNLGYLLPLEGSVIQMDTLTVASSSQNPELAQQFINFLLEPKMNAQNAQFIRYPTPNLDAQKLLPRALLENTALYPNALQLRTLEPFKQLGNAQRILDEAWTRFKSR